MAKDKVKKQRSEGQRKLIVSLKKRPHNIALVLMGVTFLVYSLNLTKISNTTAVVNKPFMGICAFVIMLFSILAFVCFLNAFPARQAPKLPMVILLYLMEAIVVLCDIVYVLKINEGLQSIKITSSRQFIPQAKVILIIHAVLMVACIVITILIPTIKKALGKIDTSIKLAENSDIANIELSDGE